VNGRGKEEEPGGQWPHFFLSSGLSRGWVEQGRSKQQTQKRRVQHWPYNPLLRERQIPMQLITFFPYATFRLNLACARKNFPFSFPFSGAQISFSVRRAHLFGGEFQKKHTEVDHSRCWDSPDLASRFSLFWMHLHPTPHFTEYSRICFPWLG
jgi:hypothetical protein